MAGGDRPGFVQHSGPDLDAPRRSVHGRWEGGYQVRLSIREGRFVLSSDERMDDGGDDSGPMPSELLFASVASCFAMALAWCAKKRHQLLPDLEVVVGWGYDRAQRRYDKVEVVATSSMALSSPGEFDTLVRLAEEVCWVTRSIATGLPIRFRTSAPAGAGEA